MAVTHWFPCEKAGNLVGEGRAAETTKTHMRRPWPGSLSSARKRFVDVDDAPIVAARQTVSKCRKPGNRLLFFQALTGFYRRGSASSSRKRFADDSSDGDGIHDIIFGKYNILENAWHNI